ncbi:MAG: sugar ABC transporter substrate-binding protein [Phycisphaerae bacterium]|nr:sugar ABC transporter substrate-binding protein [Phycisphaerae bacterium]
MSWTHVRRRFAGGSALTALSYLIVFASLMGCERSDGPPSGDARALRGALVAVIGPAEGHPQWPGIRGGAERFAAGNPSLRLLCTAPREEWGETLATAVERVLSDRPAIVCLWITDPEAAAPSVARIANQQVVLVTMNARATAGYPAAHVDLDWSSAAHLLGSQLGVVAAGRRSYVLVHEEGRDPLATACYRRFAAAASRQYDLTLLEARRGTGDPRAAVEELLGRFSHAGLVITLNPDVWLTARAGWDGELRARNREFRFATLSAAPVLWSRLGTPAAPGDAAALVGPLDGQIGYAAVELAARLLLGTQRATLERVISCELVTPETLADFAQRYAAAANGLDVSKWLPRTTTAPAAR